MNPNISVHLQLGLFLAGLLLVASPAAVGNAFPASYFPITQTGAAQTQNNDVRLAQVTAEAEEHFQRGRNRLVNGEVDAARDEFQKALETIGIAGIESADKERLRLLYLKFVTRIRQAFEQQINKVPGSSSELENSDTKVSVIISRSEDYFRKGKLSLDENKPVAARDEFDKSIDVILESGLDVRANRRLQSFYLELIERIYREEVPIGHGSSTVANQKKTEYPEPPSRVGFREQKFEPSPLDDLPLVPQERNLRAGSAAANRNPVRSKQQQDARLGSKPPQSGDGKVPAVMNWFRENLHDPYSMRFVHWSKVERGSLTGQPSWVVTVRFRAKNAFGAYLLADYTFHLRRNKVVYVSK